MSIYDKSAYTELQQRIISGELPKEQVFGRAAAKLLKKAESLNDDPVIALAKEIVSTRKEEAKERHRVCAHDSERNIMHGTNDHWVPPKNTEYTDFQERIVNGDVAMETVNMRDIVRTYQKAVSRGETDIAARLWKIIEERREKRRHYTFFMSFFNCIIWAKISRKPQHIDSTY